MTLTVLPVHGLGEMREGDDLAAAIAGAVRLHDRDVVVVAQKVVSKIEGAVVEPPPVAEGEDPRRALARSVAAAIVAESPQALIVRTSHGFVCANAGIDASNVPGGQLSLLPDDPDASARALRRGLASAAGVDVAVLIADTFGRAWRTGQVDVTIGLAGLQAIRDERGGFDRDGHVLAVTETAVADELAAAADLVRRKAAGVPVVVIRGFEYATDDDARATDLVRDEALDLFARGRGMLAAALLSAWPDGPMTPLTDDDVVAVHRVAPEATVIAAGPPTALALADPFAAGLAAAVLADAGASVRWRAEDAGVIVEGGRLTAGR